MGDDEAALLRLSREKRCEVAGPLLARRRCSLPKAHAWSTTVLVGELHAGGVKTRFDRLTSRTFSRARKSWVACASRLARPKMRLAL
jgi:hypothetical protein